MDIRIEAGTNCVNLSENTYPLNVLGIRDLSGSEIEIFNAQNDKTIYKQPWDSFKNSSNARYADKPAVITALKAVFYGPIA